MKLRMFFYSGSVKMKTIDGKEKSFLVNGHTLTTYQQPSTLKELIQYILQKYKMDLVGGEGFELVTTLV